jgi:hypothetical protein
MFHDTLKVGFMAWPESMGGPFLTGTCDTLGAQGRTAYLCTLCLDCRHQSLLLHHLPTPTYTHSGGGPQNTDTKK